MKLIEIDRKYDNGFLMHIDYDFKRIIIYNPYTDKKDTTNYDEPITTENIIEIETKIQKLNQETNAIN